MTEVALRRPKPSPERLPLMEALKTALASIAEERSAIYVAGPVTSGPRYTQWLRENCSQSNANVVQDERREAVILPNLEEGRRKAGNIRQQVSGRLVIEPFTLDLWRWRKHDPVYDWSQDDYRFFWGSIVEEFAASVILLDGWQWSSGSVYEFYTACRLNIIATDERGKRIVISDAIEQIEGAISELDEFNSDTKFLKTIVKVL